MDDAECDQGAAAGDCRTEGSNQEVADGCAQTQKIGSVKLQPQKGASSTNECPRFALAPFVSLKDDLLKADWGYSPPLLNQINKAFQLEGVLLDYFHARVNPHGNVHHAIHRIVDAVDEFEIHIPTLDPFQLRQF